MSLTAVEKCAGKMFREGAEAVLAQSLLDFPDSVPCRVSVCASNSTSASV